MLVSAYLLYWQQITNTSAPNFYRLIGPITSPPANYNDVYGEGIVYRYVWEITVENSTSITIPPIGFTMVDASTGQILPNPPLS
jgi:hypothetical protein